ncbi:hypothetical protein [Nostoc sp. ChiQUE01b]|uniref:hypothetical protein n=1 Tax=Nostoc sp. ChiQUE01b TaxID=3075376 RepID=UPI002AD28056|nr:hypothetical protein [Nostoc sp. ChiQUE01b]MDZ8257240.1 hypothetical protein [Nostoc sp. ChiQUE01b]
MTNYGALAYARQLLANEQVNRLKPILDELLPKLNAYLKTIGNREQGAEEDEGDEERR